VVLVGCCAFWWLLKVCGWCALWWPLKVALLWLLRALVAAEGGAAVVAAHSGGC
jgi:hypothetical protein